MRVSHGAAPQAQHKAQLDARDAGAVPTFTVANVVSMNAPPAQMMQMQPMQHAQPGYGYPQQQLQPGYGYPQQQGYPPQQGYAPQQGGYPPQQGGYPPQQGYYVPQPVQGGAYGNPMYAPPHAQQGPMR